MARAPRPCEGSAPHAILIGPGRRRGAPLESRATEPLLSAGSRSRWDAAAPGWALALILLCGTGLATVWIDLGEFWRSYVLDMTGPAWSYILFRGRYTARADNRWTRVFTPVRTLVAFLLVCFGIEGAQYLGLYDATFDPWDLVAYLSLLLPLFALDLWTLGDHRTRG